MTRRERMLALADELSKAERGSGQLDLDVGRVLGRPAKPYTTDPTTALSLVGEKYDWIMASVNGQVGGTPYAQVGQHTCYAATPVLALCAAVLTAVGSDPRFVYAVAYKDNLGTYGMVYGPAPTMEECFGFEPAPGLYRGSPCYVLRFEGEHNQVIARWNPRAGRWVERVTMTIREAGIEA